QRAQDADLLDEGLDGALPRRGGSHRGDLLGAGDPRRQAAADDQLRGRGSGVRPRLHPERSTRCRRARGRVELLRLRRPQCVDRPQARRRLTDKLAPMAEGLARSLPSWEPFPEVRSALEEARGRGWKLAILSNTDRDFIEASMQRIGVPFELAIVASEIGSYKPAHRHWERFFEQTAAA